MTQVEQWVAVDNVCAWPNLTVLPDGQIVATIFNQPCHGLWEGDVECWASGDGGMNWARRGIPGAHEPGTNRMNVAAGLARTGDFIVIASGWSGMKAPGNPLGTPHHKHAKVLKPWVCRSRDRAATFTRAQTVSGDPSVPFVPFGKIIQTRCADREVLACGFYNSLMHNDRTSGAAYILFSHDDGQTWGDARLIADNHNETDLLAVGDGVLLAASRSLMGGHLDLLRSDDGGQTWSLDQQLTMTGMHPAHLLQLKSGDILLTYGIRHRGLFGIGARYSADQGRGWYAPMVVVNFSNDACWDGGYPSSVELPDGRVLTAFYANKTADHPRYHMGVARWNHRKRFECNSKTVDVF